MNNKKPLIVGLGPVLDKKGKAGLFTKRGANVYMQRSKKRLPRPDLFHVVVAEFDQYFRGSLAGK